MDDGTEEIQPRFQHLVDQLTAEGYDAPTIRRMMRSMHGCGFNLNTFPNVAMSLSFFRVLIPISVNETEIWHMAIGMDGGPEYVNQERLRIHEHFQGPFGFGSPPMTRRGGSASRSAAPPTRPCRSWSTAA